MQSDTYSLFEGIPPNMFLLLALHRIIHGNSRLKYMQLSLGKYIDSWQKGTVGVPERVWEEEAKH